MEYFHHLVYVYKTLQSHSLTHIKKIINQIIKSHIEKKN